MSDLLVVGVSDYKISKEPSTIATYALGSCVGTSIYDEKNKVGGLSHIMLPESALISSKGKINRMKFADTALVDMVNELVGIGADRRLLKAKIAGGANMFESQSFGTFGNIGKKNVESVKVNLRKLNIPIVGEDTGANYGRTVFLDIGSGEFQIKSIGKDIKTL